jgi:hypothetical protein
MMLPPIAVKPTSLFLKQATELYSPAGRRASAQQLEPIQVVDSQVLLDFLEFELRISPLYLRRSTDLVLQTCNWTKYDWVVPLRTNIKP